MITQGADRRRGERQFVGPLDQAQALRQLLEQKAIADAPPGGA